MAWAAQTGGGWLHSGTTDDVWVFSTSQTGTGAIVAQLFDPAVPIGIFLYGSTLADTRWEVLCTSGTSGNIVIRKWTLGVPASAAATAPHLLTTGDTYTVQVRWVNGLIGVYLNNSTTAVVTYDTASDLGEFTGIGFWSATDQAMVGSFKLYALVRDFAILADVGWWVAAGTLYASDSGRGGAKVIGTFFDSTARIFSAEGKQHGYIFDGSKGIDFDAALMTAGPLTLTAGTLPGQTGLNDPPGACTATAAAYNYDRLLIASGNNVYGSAIGFGTPDLDFDLSSDALGKAFVLPAQSGQPLNALFVQDRNRLIYTGQRASWELSGDPTIGADSGIISAMLGATGPFSGMLAEQGMLFMHTNEGMCVIPSGAGIGHLSRDVLTDIIQQDMAADNLLVSLCPDLKRHGIWVFLTPIDGASSGRHLFYDVRVGRYLASSDPLSQLGGGGWFPIDFGDPSLQPTCSMNFRGEVVFGTRDGRMLFMDSGATDDAGHAFTTRITLNMLRDEDMENGTLLRSFELAMGLGSADSTLTVLGGETPERAFLDGFTVYGATMKYVRNSFNVSGSAAALVLKIESAGRIALESCQVDSQPTTLIPTQRRPAVAPSSPCAPPPAPATPPDDNTGGGPGPGGDPDVCTACATWMAANKTGTVGGKDAYVLAGGGFGNTLVGAQAEVASALATLTAANLCSPVSPTNPNLYITTSDAAFTTGPVLSASDFAALSPGDYNADNKTWKVNFRCEDQ